VSEERSVKTFDIQTVGLDQLVQDIREANVELSQLISVLYGVTSILSRMGLPPNVSKAIRELMRLISTVNMLRTSLIALQAASGPVGWAYAAVGLVGVGLNLAQQMDMARPRY